MLTYRIVLLILAAYFPFEEFLLKWIPVSDTTFLFLRQIPDGIVILLFILSLSSLRVLRYRYAAPVMFAISVITAYVLFVLYFNDASFIHGMLNYKALIRYVLIFFVVLLIQDKQGFYDDLSKVLYYASILQIGIGLAQYVGGITVRDFLAGRETVESIYGYSSKFTGARWEGVNDLMGTMGNTINYAMFLLVSMIFRISSRKMCGISDFLYLFFVILCIYLTGSRAVLFVSLLILLIHYSGLYRRSPIYWVSAATISFIFLFYLASDVVGAFRQYDALYVFTGDYVEEAKKQRLGVFLYVLPLVMSDIMGYIGYSPDKTIIVDVVVLSGSAVPDILKAVIDVVIEDVYWVALIAYYGLPLGMAMFLGLIYLLRRSFLWLMRYSWSGPVLTMFYLSISALLLNFFNQAFEVRQFSYYFWLAASLIGPSIMYDLRKR